ncbi:hypothetical protein [Embleya sp. NPDC059237]|uniref:hypothetical protein n=1 Tax=Embleya sp. NPDC059237 TaxID=3346784 RepID=UPI0036A16207
MAETVHLLGEGGGVWAMDLPLSEPIAERLARGHLRRVNPDGSPWTDPDDADPAEVPAPPTERPAPSAPKAAWVGWAVACGADPETADGMTKADLIEKYGGAADGQG